ncbi:hypothetical protein ACTFIW_009557 [Dictyostelium discoideum]
MMENLFGDEVEVPLLVQLCTQRIKDSLETCKDLGKIPDELLIPILDKCTAQQLATVESRIGRYVDTEELWKRHCHIISPEIRHTLKDDESWRDLFTILEREYQNKTKKTGEALRKIYNNAANNKKSKQIKVLNDVVTPTASKRWSGTVSKTPSYKQSGSSSPGKYSNGSPISRSESSSSGSSGGGSGSYGNVFKPSASNQPKLMAKVLKEHNRKFK